MEDEMPDHDLQEALLAAAAVPVKEERDL